MKRALVISFAFGAGVAAAGAAAFALLNWYANRPRPWNPSAITATFDSISAEGPEKKLVFHYVLQNNTDHDFRVNSQSQVILDGKLARQHSLLGAHWESFYADFPLFLPARSRARILIHLGYSYKGSEPLSAGATIPDRERDRALIAAFVRDQLSNLDGFVLFHDQTHYQVDLPNGWGQKSAAASQEMTP